MPHESAAQQRLLICLLGGRIQPAAMTAVLTRPNIVACVVSASEPRVADRLLDMLQARQGAATRGPICAVNPASALEAEQAVQQLLDAFPHAQPIISLTGATMPMGVGACAAARRVGCPAYYLDTARSALVDLVHEDSTEPVDLRLGIVDFMHVHGLQVRPADAALIDQPPPPLYVQALALLVEDLPCTSGLLRWLTEKGYKDHPWRRVWTLDDRALLLLERLGALGLLDELRLQGSGEHRTVYAKIANADHSKFLGGHWLEYYTYLVAKNIVYQGAPLFDSAACSLHMQSGASEREIDFVGLRGGVPLIASCKTSAKEPWEKGAIDEVAVVGKNLGDNYCTKLYITNQNEPQPGEKWYRAHLQFCEQASKASVVVVTGRDLLRLGEILQREAINPTYKPR